MKRTIATFLVCSGIFLISCSNQDTSAPTKVRLLAYDSFVVSEGIFDDFTAQTGFEVEVVTGGDAGELLAKASVTAGNPEADVLWGIDNTLLTRAIDADIFTSYKSDQLDAIDQELLNLIPDATVTPVDTGDVCLNIDRVWFDENAVNPPTRLADLAKPEYAGLTVIPSAVTSSTGLAFLLASIAEFGDGWQEWWRQLIANEALVVDGWTRAYTVEFSGSSGAGDYPIVVSYGTSPPAEVLFADPPVDTPRTAVVADGCFRQVEFAGVLRGANNEDGAQALIDYLISAKFQADIPLNMFVYPVNNDVVLPKVFTDFAVKPERPLVISPSEIDTNRETWLGQWLALVG
jgi:thiamine transport system substrate-binding protein